MTSVSVYLIGGTTRSGSTLLASLLTSATGGFDAGELHLLWRSMTDGRLCTCGKAVRQCGVWADVAECVTGDLDAYGIEELVAISETERRQRDFLRPRVPRPPTQLVQLRTATYRAIANVTGAGTIVDSSKLGSVLDTVLHGVPEARAVHLVRDARAVAYSWASPASDPSLGGAPMPSLSPHLAGPRWLGTNLAMERIAKRWPGRVTRLRYEDLVADPSSVVLVLTAPAPKAARPGPDPTSHAIAGNPHRFGSAREIRLDARWQHQLTTSARWTVAAVTWPLLRRYGYL